MICYCEDGDYQHPFRINNKEFHLPFSIRPGESGIGFVPFEIGENQAVHIRFDENFGPDVSWEFGRVQKGRFYALYEDVQKNKNKAGIGQKRVYTFFPPFVHPGLYQLQLKCLKSNRCQLSGTIEREKIFHHKKAVTRSSVFCLY